MKLKDTVGYAMIKDICGFESPLTMIGKIVLVPVVVIVAGLLIVVEGVLLVKGD